MDDSMKDRLCPSSGCKKSSTLNPKTPDPKRPTPTSTSSPGLLKTPCINVAGEVSATPSRSPCLDTKESLLKRATLHERRKNSTPNMKLTNVSNITPIQTKTMLLSPSVSDSTTLRLGSTASPARTTLKSTAIVSSAGKGANITHDGRIINNNNLCTTFSPTTMSGVISPQLGVNCSTPKINIYATTSSGLQENIYSTPCNDDTQKEPTYQSLAQTSICQDSFVDENGNSLNVTTNNPDNKCLTKDQNDNTRLKPDDDFLTFLSPHRFLKPLDRSSFLRSPMKFLDDGMTWQQVARIILCLASLVMNCESMVNFPLYLATWRAQGILVYLVMLLVIGLPVFIMEVLLGSMEKRTSLTIWSSMIPLMSGMGPALLTSSVFLAAKTVVVSTYSLVYMSASVVSPLPWTQCDTWWGPDSRCFSTKDIEHLDLNRSLLCTLYDLAGEDCHSHEIPSHVQFWENYVLQIDHRGLRVLGYLGHPNVTLILAAAGLWTFLGLLALVTKRMRVQLVSLLSVCLLCIMIVVATWNMIKNSALHRMKEYLTFTGGSALFNERCYLDAFWLILSGLNLFNGSIITYSSMFKKIEGVKLISLICILLHLLYVVLATLIILPLVPSNLNTKELTEKKELGYFPHALISLDLVSSTELSAFTFLVYLVIFLSSCSQLMGLTANIQLLQIYTTYTRLRKLLAGAGIALVGFLTTLPLMYQAGPSLVSLFYVYGYKVPLHVLAPLICMSVFWLYGSRRMAKRTQGNFWHYLLVPVWSLKPLILMGLGGLFFFSELRIAEPAPLPTWAHNLGIFLATFSTSQVLAGAILNMSTCIRQGKGVLVRQPPKVMAYKNNNRTIAELCEMKTPAHSNTYKSFDDIFNSDHDI